MVSWKWRALCKIITQGDVQGASRRWRFKRLRGTGGAGGRLSCRDAGISSDRKGRINRDIGGDGMNVPLVMEIWTDISQAQDQHYYEGIQRPIPLLLYPFRKSILNQ